MLTCTNVRWLVFLIGILKGVPMAVGDTGAWDGKIVQHGKMHDAIGKQQHQGRVQLKTLVARPHFFGVGAIERLAGEATIYDGKVTVTRVDAKGRLEPSGDTAHDMQATLLVGAYVPSWSEYQVAADVSPDELDKYIEDMASRAGINTPEPFVFALEGEFRDVRLHVINGACPMHARLKRIEIPAANRPFETELEKVRGTIVGVFAKDAVGDVTHPGTSTHMHLLFKETVSGKTVTGHIEQAGVRKGAIVRLPK